MAPCKFFDPDEPGEVENSIDRTKYHPSIGNKLEALLAEYNSLKLEIQNRSQMQNRFIQIHIIALTSIIGFAFYQGSRLWALFLIPIESSLLGLWYLDHAIQIIKIGEYIQDSIEPKVWILLDDTSIMRWETHIGSIDKLKIKPQKIYNFRWLLFLTFGGPSFLILFLTAASLVYAQEFYCLFRMNPAFALISWSVGFIFAIFYSLSAKERSKLSDARKHRNQI